MMDVVETQIADDNEDKKLGRSLNGKCEDHNVLYAARKGTKILKY